MQIHEGNMCNASGYECLGLWLWMIQMRRNDSERQNMKRWWLKGPEGICTMALDAKLKKDGGIKCLNEYEKWLWTPKLRMTMDLTVETGNGDGSKRRNGWVMMAPNAKTGNVDGSERWLRIDDDSERQTENSDGYECQNWE